MRKKAVIKENGSQPANNVPNIPVVPPLPVAPPTLAPATPAPPAVGPAFAQIPDFEAMAANFQVEWNGLVSPLMAFLNRHQRMRTMEPFCLTEAIRNLQLCAILGKEARIQFLVIQQRDLVQLIQQQGQQAVPSPALPAPPAAPEGKG